MHYNSSLHQPRSSIINQSRSSSRPRTPRHLPTIVMFRVTLAFATVCLLTSSRRHRSASSAEDITLQPFIRRLRDAVDFICPVSEAAEASESRRPGLKTFVVSRSEARMYCLGAIAVAQAHSVPPEAESYLIIK